MRGRRRDVPGDDTAHDAEWPAGLYTQDFFGKTANLTVSGQLNVKTFCMAVYTFGLTFRAEKNYTPRHAAEFWMVEPEIAFADLLDDM